MSRSTISTFKLFELFPDEPSARKYLESRLWKDGVTCPECKSKERITVRKDGFYRCNADKLDFTVRTGTIFERSHVPLHKWLYAMYLLVTARNLAARSSAMACKLQYVSTVILRSDGGTVYPSSPYSLMTVYISSSRESRSQ